jgi:hypothetical protein
MDRRRGAVVRASDTAEVIDTPGRRRHSDAMTTTTTDVTNTVDCYLAAYSEPDPRRRAELIDTVWTEDAQLVDPPVTGEGHDGIAAVAEALQQQFPGHRFRRTSAVDVHHDRLRFEWKLISPEGEAVLTGMDVGELAPDGRLSRITGFFGDLPPAS